MVGISRSSVYAVFCAACVLAVTNAFGDWDFGAPPTTGFQFGSNAPGQTNNQPPSPWPSAGFQGLQSKFGGASNTPLSDLQQFGQGGAQQRGASAKSNANPSPERSVASFGNDQKEVTPNEKASSRSSVESNKMAQQGTGNSQRKLDTSDDAETMVNFDPKQSELKQMSPQDESQLKQQVESELHPNWPQGPPPPWQPQQQRQPQPQAPPYASGDNPSLLKYDPIYNTLVYSNAKYGKTVYLRSTSI